MDNCTIIDLKDGEGIVIVFIYMQLAIIFFYVEIYGGNPVKNAWKINNETKNKWYILYSKDPTIKEAWMDAFERERQIVKDDAISRQYKLNPCVICSLSM